MRLAAWESASPLASPSGSPYFRVSERNEAPEARPQSPWSTTSLCSGVAIGDAAPFAASGVKAGVTGEGGATPLISRDLDPAPHGTGPAPQGSLPPRRHGRAKSL